MITISRRSQTVNGVEFQVGRASAPDRPIMISIDGVSANLTTREACDMASVGDKIGILLRRAKKSGGMPDDRRLMLGELAGVEFTIGISCRNDIPGVELQFSGRTFRFVDEDIGAFRGVLKQIDIALNEHRGAQPGGGPQQFQVNADDVFRARHPELEWLYR
jgi:hypothetical protein